MIKETFLTLAILVFGCSAFAQMNYQFVMLDTDDEPLANTTIGIQFKIRSNSMTGNILYQETNTALTDDFGRANSAIGAGNPVVGNYASIPRTGVHFLEVEVDITGGTNYTSFTNSQIFPAFKADEIDPVYISSPAGGITQLEIDNWNAFEVSTVVPLDQTNYQSISIGNHDMVDVRGIINITSNYTAFSNKVLTISGGGFSGTGSETIALGNNEVVIIGAYFEFLDISGSRVTFLNCRFNSVNRFPNDSRIIGGSLDDCILPTTYIGSQFISVEMDNCTMPRVESIINSEIEDCNLGLSSWPVPRCNGNTISDSKIYTSESFANNRCDNIELVVSEDVRFSNIIGNRFDEEFSAGLKILRIDRAGTAAQRQVKIADNFFFGDTNSTNLIEINGSYSNNSFESIVHFTGNTFTRGINAIVNNSSGVDIIVSDNVHNNISLGVVSNPSLGIYVLNNTDLQ